jgi:U6 snRNA-associated Sm-like protein LSm1
VLVVLRDGRKLIGYLRSFDQHGVPLVGAALQSRPPSCAAVFVFLFATAVNVVLEETIERIYVGDEFGDIERGLFIVRAENVCMVGELVRIPASSSCIRQLCCGMRAHAALRTGFDSRGVFESQASVH